MITTHYTIVRDASKSIVVIKIQSTSWLMLCPNMVSKKLVDLLTKVHEYTVSSVSMEPVQLKPGDVTWRLSAAWQCDERIDVG